MFDNNNDNSNDFNNNNNNNNNNDNDDNNNNNSNNNNNDNSNDAHYQLPLLSGSLFKRYLCNVNLSIAFTICIYFRTYHLDYAELFFPFQ